MAFGKPVVWSELSGRAESKWLWGKWTDTIWLVGGGYVLYTVLALPLILWSPVGFVFPLLFAKMSILCNAPHYAVTYQLLYRERKIFPRNFHELLISTPVMIAMLIASLVWVDVVWMLVIRLFLTWSAHHYVAQNFGIATMYAARDGKPYVGRGEKLALQGAFLGVGVAGMVGVNLESTDPQTAAAVFNVHAETAFGLAGLPVWFHWVGLAVVVASCVALGIAARNRRRRLGEGLGGATWGLFGLSLLWFVVPFLRNPMTGEVMIQYSLLYAAGGAAFFHCAQYLAVTAWRNRTTGPVRPIWLWAGLVALGWILFNVPHEVLTRVFTNRTIVVVGLAVTATVNIHHFWIDALIWRGHRRRRPERDIDVAALDAV